MKASHDIRMKRKTHPKKNSLSRDRRSTSMCASCKGHRREGDYNNCPLPCTRFLILRAEHSLFMQKVANIAQARMGKIPTAVQEQYKAREDGSTMKALAWFGTEDVRLINAFIPDITEPDDVIVQVTGTTICGSDLHLYHGEILALQRGDILGHEVISVLILVYNSDVCPLVHGKGRPNRPQRKELQSWPARCGLFPNSLRTVQVLPTEVVFFL